MWKESEAIKDLEEEQWFGDRRIHIFDTIDEKFFPVLKKRLLANHRQNLFTLILYDDSTGESVFAGHSRGQPGEWQKWFTRQRHLGVSTVMASHHFTATIFLLRDAFSAYAVFFIPDDQAKEILKRSVFRWLEWMIETQLKKQGDFLFIHPGRELRIWLNAGEKLLYDRTAGGWQIPVPEEIIAGDAKSLLVKK